MRTKMAGRLSRVFIALLLLFCLQVRKPSFISIDSLYVKHYNKDSRQLGETFIFTGLWQSVGSRFKCAVRCSNSTFLGLLLLMCGDVEPCLRQIKILDLIRS